MSKIVYNTKRFFLDPPRFVKVSTQYVEVTENQYPPSVKCSGAGRPALNYVWKNKKTSEVITDSDVLSLGPMTRSLAGTYTCNASNKHGNESLDVIFYMHCIYLTKFAKTID